MSDAEGIKWDLSIFYKGLNDEKIDEDLKKADLMADQLSKKYRKKIPEISAEDLVNFFHEYEEFLETAAKPNFYALLRFSENTLDQNTQQLLSRIEKRLTEATNKLIFIDLEINEISEERFTQLLENPTLNDYRHYLELIRLMKPYLLGEEAEQVLQKKSLTSLAAWQKFFEEYTGNFDFKIDLEGDGKIQTLTGPQLRNLFTAPDRDLRERAFLSFYEVYQENRLALKTIFNSVFMDHTIIEEIRKYENPMVPAFIRDQVEGDVIQLLLDVTRKNYPLFQEFLRLKAKILGLPKLKGWDMLAPYPAPEKIYSWEKAQQIILDSFGDFSSELQEVANLFFQRQWIDAEVRKGKRGGAACWVGTIRINPWIFLSFEGKLQNVATLAHELGHGIHNYIAGQNQNYFNKRQPTVLAETASVFGEMLVTHKFLKTANVEEKKKLIMDQLDEYGMTVFRQILYILWELDAHNQGREGTLSDEDLRQLWVKHIEELYGDAVEFPKVMDWAFLAIPHFISYLYYCYSYAFGHLFVVSLYQKYLEEGKKFVPKYLALLKSGGKDFPAKLAKDMGVDLTSEDFWQGGFDHFQTLLEELKELIND